MITPATGLMDPGHPGPPRTIALVPFPCEQVPDDAARQLDERRAHGVPSRTMTPVCETVFNALQIDSRRTPARRPGRNPVLAKYAKAIGAVAHLGLQPRRVCRDRLSSARVVVRHAVPRSHVYGGIPGAPSR